MEAWAAYEGESWAEVARLNDFRDGKAEVGEVEDHKKGGTSVVGAAGAAASEVVEVAATGVVEELGRASADQATPDDHHDGGHGGDHGDARDDVHACASVYDLQSYMSHPWEHLRRPASEIHGASHYLSRRNEGGHQAIHGHGKGGRVARTLLPSELPYR